MTDKGVIIDHKTNKGLRVMVFLALARPIKDPDSLNLAKDSNFFFLVNFCFKKSLPNISSYAAVPNRCTRPRHHCIRSNTSVWEPMHLTPVAIGFCSGLAMQMQQTKNRGNRPSIVAVASRFYAPVIFDLLQRFNSGLMQRCI